MCVNDVRNIFLYPRTTLQSVAECRKYIGGIGAGGLPVGEFDVGIFSHAAEVEYVVVAHEKSYGYLSCEQLR